MTKVIQLTEEYSTLIDDKWYEYLMQWNWRYAQGYAVRSGTIEDGEYFKRTIFMHRVIMNTPDDMETDHISGNRLDNRVENLRICTSQENSFNAGKTTSETTSKYKGVSFRNGDEKWRARIQFNGEMIHLGDYCCEELASIKYNESAIKYFGSFARLNQVQHNEEECESCKMERVPSSYNRGVFRRENNGNWRSAIRVNGKLINLGSYTTEIAAANAYNRAAIKYFGDRAILNDVLHIENLNDYMHKYSSEYNGVFWCNNKKRWISKIRYNNEIIHLGNYKLEVEAAKAYNEAIRRFELDENKLNYIENEEDIVILTYKQRTSSKFRGVKHVKQYNKWEAVINKDKKSYYIGRYKTEIEAAIAYNQKAIELYGENYNRLNII